MRKGCDREWKMEEMEEKNDENSDPLLLTDFSIDLSCQNHASLSRIHKSAFLYSNSLDILTMGFGY